MGYVRADDVALCRASDAGVECGVWGGYYGGVSVELTRGEWDDLVYVTIAGNTNLHLYDTYTHIDLLVDDEQVNPFSPIWLYDGSELAYTKVVNGVQNIFILNMQTGIERQLTFDDIFEAELAWSPDGKYIAYTTRNFSPNFGTESQDIKVVEVASGIIETLDSNFANGTSNLIWSPDSQKLAFNAPLQEFEPLEVNVIDISSKVTMSITDNIEPSVSVHDWSQDGRTVLVLLNQDRGIDYTPENMDWSIAIIDIEKKVLKQLTKWEGVKTMPRWSYDESMILFYGKRDNLYPVNTMKSDGTDMKQVTQIESRFVWNPWSRNKIESFYHSVTNGIHWNENTTRGSYITFRPN
jgi:Tol biopolymer transport system component